MVLAFGKKGIAQAFPLSDGAESKEFSWLVQRDPRDFHQLLEDWMLGFDCMPGAGNMQFLQKIGLYPYVKEDDWEDLRLGKKAPGSKLISHLTVLFPNEDKRKEINLPNPRVFQNRAVAELEHSRKGHVPELELSDMAYRALRKPMLDKICSQTPPGEMLLDGNRLILSREDYRLVGKLAKQLKSIAPDIPRSDLLPLVMHAYRAQPEAVLSGMQAMLNQDQPRLKEWLDRLSVASERYQRAGQLLRFFRECAGLSQERMAEKIGMHGGTISRWENGMDPISENKLSLIKQTLNLSADEYHRLILARWPALDPGYLETQPPKWRTALLLTAWRELLGISNENLRKQVGSTSVSHWCSGRAAVPPRAVPGLSKILHLRSEALPDNPLEFDRDYFERVCAQSYEARHMAVDTVQLGAATKSRSAIQSRALDSSRTLQ